MYFRELKQFECIFKFTIAALAQRKCFLFLMNSKDLIVLLLMLQHWLENNNTMESFGHKEMSVAQTFKISFLDYLGNSWPTFGNAIVEGMF